MKEEHPDRRDEEDVSQSAVDRLNPHQRLLYDTVISHWEESLNLDSYGYDAPRHRQLLLQVDGRGGTGKSYTLKVISAAIRRLSIAHGLQHSVLEKAASTGVAAYTIGGQTIHSLLRLPVTTAGDLPELTIGEATNIRRRLQHLEYLILDEKSMIGVRLFNYIDRRMRQIFENDLYFGGRNMILLGDFHQLPPVLQQPLFRDVGSLRDPRDKAGRMA